jgi:hypothetical protein
MKYLQFLTVPDRYENKIGKMFWFRFFNVFFPFWFLHSQTLGPPKPIQKNYSHGASNNVYNYFKHNTFHINNTYYYHSLPKNRYEHFKVQFIVDSVPTLKVNQLKLQMKEISDSLLPTDKICSDFSKDDSLILLMKDTVNLMRLMTFNGLPSWKIPLLLEMPSLTKLDTKPDTAFLSKKKRLHFGMYSSLGFFCLPECGAFGGVYKILGISFWQNITERIKIRENIDFQFAQSWILEKDILREYYTDDEVSGYRLDVSEEYTFNGATISVDLPVEIINSSRAFLYLYYGFGVWYAKQHFKCIRSDTYELISEEEMSLVHTQSIQPIDSIGILYRDSRLKAITVDLGYRFAKNEKSMNSSFFMDIDSFTHMWLISVGFIL